jgi:hypothetical protein
LKLKSTGVEGIVGFLLRDTKKGSVTAGQVRQDDLETEMHFISYEGIFVNNADVLPSWLGSEQSKSIYSDLNFKRQSVDLNVARNELVENQKLIRTLTTLELDLLQLVREYLRKLKKSHPEVDSKFYELSNGFIQAFIRFKKVPDKESCRRISSLYRDFYYFKCASETGLKYMLSKDIAAAKKPIVVFHSVPNTMPAAYGSYGEWYTMPNIEYLIDMMRRCEGFSENELYILPDFNYFGEYGFRLRALLNHLFPSYANKDFLEYFEFEQDDQLRNVLPSTWVVCRFSNYDSDRFIEFEFKGRTYLNINNRFVKLLTENCQKLNPQQKELANVLIRAFCESFEAALRDGKVSDVIQRNQGAILDIFESAGLIPRDSLNSFLIEQSDYPPDLLEHWWS